MVAETSPKHSQPLNTRRRNQQALRRPAALGVLALAVVAALLSFVPHQASAQGHFSDTADHWAHDSINHLMDAGVLGDPHSTWCGPSEFCPNDPTPRWIAVVWMTHAIIDAQWTGPNNFPTSSFSDVSLDDYWSPHLEYLTHIGLIVGYPDGTFRPHEPVTRRQMNTLMRRSGERNMDPTLDLTLKQGAFVVRHGCADGSLDCPNERVSRGESVANLAAARHFKLRPRPTDPPPGEEFWTVHEGISAGDYHTCALLHAGYNDDRLACWGINLHGQLDNPNPRHWKYKYVAAGGSHTCAIRLDNKIDCWGLNNHGQTDAPDGSYKAVAAGRVSTCAIGTNHKLVCWGKYLGEEPPTYSFDNLTVGTNHACAIRRGGVFDSNRKRAYCWGSDSHGQVSDLPPHHPSGRNIQFQSTGRKYFGIAAGHNFTCSAIHDGEDRRISGASNATYVSVDYRQCWGLDDRGQAPNRHEPNLFPDWVHGDTKLVEHGVGAGWWHACAIRDELKTPYCWGNNNHGQLNHPRNTSFAALAVGATHACGVKHDHRMECWGFNI